MLDGRVKTLHPRLHAGILARRDSPAHLAAIKAAGIEPIDLVVVNLYPFARAVAKSNCTLAEAIENIDVGGPSMLRAGAKNYAGVAVVTDPSDYSKLLAEIDRKSTRLNSSHGYISYAVFCLKKKKQAPHPRHWKTPNRRRRAPRT